MLPPANPPPPGLPIMPLAKSSMDAPRDGLGPHKPPRTSRSNRRNAPSSSSHAPRHRLSTVNAERSLALDQASFWVTSFWVTSFLTSLSSSTSDVAELNAASDDVASDDPERSGRFGLEARSAPAIMAASGPSNASASACASRSVSATIMAMPTPHRRSPGRTSTAASATAARRACSDKPKSSASSALAGGGATRSAAAAVPHPPTSRGAHAGSSAAVSAAHSTRAAAHCKGVLCSYANSIAAAAVTGVKTTDESRGESSRPDVVGVGPAAAFWAWSNPRARTGQRATASLASVIPHPTSAATISSVTILKEPATG
mmetsp:Transcript_16009/g.67446  ORF Transcript_16009/g.67446 Transcript_16009/m.67446 type:complete len:316 (-) Transcript_16009:723-1670(-)